MKLIYIPKRGEYVPWYYGFAWRKYSEDATVVIPIPLNILARLLRSFWLFLARDPNPWYPDPRDAYEQGRRDERKRWSGDL